MGGALRGLVRLGPGLRLIIRQLHEGDLNDVQSLIDSCPEFDPKPRVEPRFFNVDQGHWAWGAFVSQQGQEVPQLVGFLLATVPVAHLPDTLLQGRDGSSVGAAAAGGAAAAVPWVPYEDIVAAIRPLECGGDNPGPSVLVHLMHILPEYQRKGLASRLLGMLRSGAAAAGCHAMWLIVRASNEGAIAFYRARGFKSIAATIIPGSPHVDHLMHMPLGPTAPQAKSRGEGTGGEGKGMEGQGYGANGSASISAPETQAAPSRGAAGSGKAWGAWAKRGKAGKKPRALPGEGDGERFTATVAAAALVGARRRLGPAWAMRGCVVRPRGGVACMAMPGGRCSSLGARGGHAVWSAGATAAPALGRIVHAPVLPPRLLLPPRGVAHGVGAGGALRASRIAMDTRAVATLA